MKFSKKIAPLFKLLSARSIVESKDFTTKYSEEDQKEWTSLSKVDTVLFSGGRDSSKTFSLSTFNVIASRDFNHRILYTRQTMSSTDNSITEALENRMEDLGCSSDFIAANKTYTLKPNEEGKDRKGKITITGQKTSVGTQTAKLKSLEDYSIFETDEGEELESYASWIKTKRSMRAKDVQCLGIISFNPPTREHWIYEQFYQDVTEGFNGIKDNILYIHTTYLDNGEKNMAEHNWLEYEGLRIAHEEYLGTPKEDRDNLPKTLVKKYKEYKYSILGGFKDKAEGVIYDDWEEGEFPDDITPVRGLDFGFDDPDAMIKVAMDHKQKKIYVKEEIYKNGFATDELCDAIKRLVHPNDLIVGDSADKRLIRDLYDRGLNIVKCIKGAGSVLRGIKLIQGYTIVVDPGSHNIKKSLNNYVWHDKRSGIPRHEWSHIPDAIRYAVTEILR